jgi:asparagine N-glycosylation enzyme membrane subunit Stt3
MVKMMAAWNTQTWTQIFQENGMTYSDPKSYFSKVQQVRLVVLHSLPWAPFTALPIRKSIWT